MGFKESVYLFFVESSEESSSDDNTKVFKSKQRRQVGLIQRSDKRVKLRENSSSDDSSSSEDDGRRGYKSKRDVSRSGPADMGATAVSQIETEKDKDAQSVHERSLKINKANS